MFEASRFWSFPIDRKFQKLWLFTWHEKIDELAYKHKQSLIAWGLSENTIMTISPITSYSLMRLRWENEKLLLKHLFYLKKRPSHWKVRNFWHYCEEKLFPTSSSWYHVKRRWSGYSIYLPTYLSSTQSLHYSSNAAAANWPLCFLCEHPPPLAIAIITTQFIRIG